MSKPHSSNESRYEEAYKIVDGIVVMADSGFYRRFGSAAVDHDVWPR